MSNNKSWLRLDNSAKIYPMLMNKQNQNLFRLTCEMKEEVIPELLQEALDLTLPRFPSLSVRLMKGFFWYYFEQNKNRATIQKESDILLKKINMNQTRGFNFRICYFQKRITVEFFHAICDGSGGIQFLKSLVYTYLTLKGEEIDSQNKVVTASSPVKPQEIEDSFVTNYKPLKLKDMKIKALKGSKAFNIPGLYFKDEGKGLIQATFSSSKVHQYCKSNGMTVTEFLGGLLMYSIYKTKGKYANSHEHLQLFVPINLRKAFNSVTLRNFSLFSRVGVDISAPDIPLQSFIQSMRESLKRDTDKSLLSNKISTTVRAEKVLIMRIMPLFVKQLIFKIANGVFGKAKKTATFSNIGKTDLPADFEKYVDKFTFQLNANKATPINMAVGTTFDNLVISFTRAITDTEIEKYFICHLTSLGFEGTVTSNMWEVDNALQKL